MKNRIGLIICLLTIVLFTASCGAKSESGQPENVVKASSDRFVISDDMYAGSNQADIIVDTKTNVEYMFVTHQNNGYSAVSGLVMLCNQDGTPLIHGTK